MGSCHDLIRFMSGPILIWWESKVGLRSSKKHKISCGQVESQSHGEKDMGFFSHDFGWNFGQDKEKCSKSHWESRMQLNEWKNTSRLYYYKCWNGNHFAQVLFTKLFFQNSFSLNQDGSALSTFIKQKIKIQRVIRTVTLIQWNEDKIGM